MNRQFILLLLAILFIGFSTDAQRSFSSQNRVEISNQSWKIWLDKKAEWANDSLFLPPYDLRAIPSNAPGCGWEALYDQSGTIETKLPATVEQYYWARNGNSFGVDGNYLGVSWFTTSLQIPREWKGKSIRLDFESARMRAEVYVNNQLAGYNLIDGVPFSVEVTKFLNEAGTNKLAVRMTDPNGNFAWQDYSAFEWGKYETIPSHGFGGITGKVVLRATDGCYIDDIFVKNKPEKNVVDVELTLKNRGNMTDGFIIFSLSENGKTVNLLTSKQKVSATGNEYLVKERIKLPDARLWSPDSPNLYLLTAEWSGTDGSHDLQTKRFGFRWFEVREVDGDKMFFLNDKRIVLRSAISWSHWPVNGIFATSEMARKQILAAKKLGLNMLNFHRAIGQTNVLDIADELGLLYYEEPGGYRNSAYNLVDDPFVKTWKREKLLQMIRRDRSHPSLIIYNMINEPSRGPKPNEFEDIRKAHQLDETRIITFASNNVAETSKLSFGESLQKSHMLPYDTILHKKGWWDAHNAPGPGVYKDQFYKSATQFERYIDHPDEIIFYGEESATGTPPRLQLIKDEIEKTGKIGWDGQQMIDQYKAFDRFLHEKGFSSAFKSVDDLCVSFGNVSYYLQGRMTENIRISNTIDGYVTNGWESTKLEDHSGIVDVYRNFKGDPSLMSYYNQPLYVAVKLRNKVFLLGDKVVADLFLINEKNLNGTYQLCVAAKNKLGISQKQNFNVSVRGGNVYGQLLQESVTFSINEPGYTEIEAELLQNGKVVAHGQDKLFALELKSPERQVSVLDSSRQIQKVLSISNTSFSECAGQLPKRGVLFLGPQMQQIDQLNHKYKLNDKLKIEALIAWISKGNTLIILKNAPYWCELFASREVTGYFGSQTLGGNWMGGNFFVRKHPIFDGLPVNTAFNWEYQSLAAYNRERLGLRLSNDECIVGCYTDHKNEMYSALSIVPLGDGKIIFSTLDLSGAILSGEKSAIVARKILENMVNYGEENPHQKNSN